MPNFQPRTTDQNRRMFGLASPKAKLAGTDVKAYLEELAADVTRGRVDRLSELSASEANEMITRLGGDPLPVAGPSTQSTRTQQLHRQKAGVKQLRTSSQVELMNTLAAGRGITPDGLANLCRKMLRGKSEPQTTEDTNKIIEALKAMNARDAKPNRRAA